MAKRLLQVIAVAVFACYVTTGCNSLPSFNAFNGVYWTAHLQTLPPNSAIEAALYNVPEIQSYHCSVAKPASSSDTRVLRQFVYSSAHSWGVISILQTEGGEKTLTLYRIWTGEIPPPQEVGDTCILMDEIYASLRRHIPELPPEGNLQETLVGVQKP